MIVYKYLLLEVVCLATIFSSLTIFQKNNPPVVKFVMPQDSSQFALSAVIPYKINVSDKEDGESKFDEIIATEVFVEVRYFPDLAKGMLFKNSTPKIDSEGYALIKKQDCFTCHATWNKIIGPSFNEIAARYKISDIGLLSDHVIKGSTGRWGNSAMPTHPDISSKEAQQIVKWILENSKDPTVDYIRGTEGSIHMHASKNLSANGVIVLQASYTDHGVAGSDASTLTGWDKTLIRLK